MSRVTRFFTAIISLLVLASCSGAPEPASVETQHQPLATTSGWIWTMQEVETKLKNGKITQEQANRTLAADGGVCATQANETPVQTTVCESTFVFECVDLPQVGLAECSNTVRGPYCSAEETAAIRRVRGAAFTNCMLDIGWKKNRSHSE